jgi:hypothetical protein
MGLYVFQVQVPGIGLTLQVMNMWANRPPFTAGRGTQPVASGRVEAAGVVDADPMTPQAPRTPTRLDFLQEYRGLVKDALVDAILDNAGGLPMAAADTLLVVASGIDPPVANPLYRTPSHRLVLRAKATDLTAFREGRIDRADARRRVQASSF